MSAEPFTDCRLRVDHGKVPPPETFLLAKTVAYRVNRVVGKTLHVTRWPRDEIPDDASVWHWNWSKR